MIRVAATATQTFAYYYEVITSRIRYYLWFCAGPKASGFTGVGTIYARYSGIGVKWHKVRLSMTGRNVNLHVVIIFIQGTCKILPKIQLCAYSIYIKKIFRWFHRNKDRFLQYRVPWKNSFSFRHFFIQIVTKNGNNLFNLPMHVTNKLTFQSTQNAPIKFERIFSSVKAVGFWINSLKSTPFTNELHNRENVKKYRINKKQVIVVSPVRFHPSLCTALVAPLLYATASSCRYLVCV